MGREVEAEFLCLAYSRKLAGRCVAGVRTDDGRWIRPVSTSPDGTLFDYDCRLDSGSGPRLLDVIRVPLGHPRPTHYQPENWVLAAGRWKHVARLTTKQALPMLDRAAVRGPELLGNRRDKLQEASLRRTPAVSSLALVQPNSVEWVVGQSAGRRRQIRAAFVLDGVLYNLVLTDPAWESKLEGLGYGVYPHNAAGIRPGDRILFTVSLGEPFRGYCYKLVAAVLVLPK